MLGEFCLKQIDYNKNNYNENGKIIDLQICNLVGVFNVLFKGTIHGGCDKTWSDLCEFQKSRGLRQFFDLVSDLT